MPTPTRPDGGASVTPGQRVGSYEITAHLGSGGMGDVYRARDSKLQRDVALKILPDSFARDADRLSRFSREARLLASLNHPHIAQIYGVEDSGDTHALVLELVEGDTLADRLRHGPLPLTETVAIARQIAEGLDAAHDKGIIHRDLKPANIKVTSDGTVKLLDFGLAKAWASDAAEPGEAEGDLTNSPTITRAAATHEGIILGTAAYMSPEQAKGRPVDRRSDLWAFGAVVYEMLTGRPVFAGDSVSELLAHVLMQEPDWSALPVTIPPAIRSLLQRCLAKDRKSRLDSAAAARFALDDATSGPLTDGVIASPPGRKRFLVAAGAGLTVGVAIATAAFWTMRREVPAPPAMVTRFLITPPAAQPLLVSNFQRSIAISPDGRSIAYVSGAGATGSLMLRRLDESAPHAVVTGSQVWEAFFSPDSQWLGFVDENNAIKKVPVGGGPALTLSRDLGVVGGASWGEDDTIAFGSLDPASGVLRVPATGGKPMVVTRPDAAKQELDHTQTAFLPGGRDILTTVVKIGGSDTEIGVVDSATGAHRTLLPGTTPQYLEVPGVDGPTGAIVFSRAGQLWGVRFDEKRLETVGDPVMLVEGVQTTRTSRAQFSVSRTGTLAYIPAVVEATIPRRSLVWVDRTGAVTPLAVLPHAYGRVVVSPDGRRAAIDAQDEESDIWILDVQREALTRLSFGPSIEQTPVWTTDGRQVIYGSTREGRVFNLYTHLANGAGSPERLTMSGNQQIPYSVTPDGSRVLGWEYTTKNSIVMWPLAPPDAPSQPLVSSGAQPSVSPNGRYLAYQSDESGRAEIYVRPFPNTADGRWQVSTTGGRQPIWAPRGPELFYLDSSNVLTSVPVETSATTFSFGASKKLFDTAFAGRAEPSYGPHPDGQRFLMTREAPHDPNATPPSIVVVLNWVDEVRGRLRLDRR